MRHLDLSGCAKITDKTLKKLSVALTPRVSRDRASCCGSGDERSDFSQDELNSVTHGLRYLSLSGCYQVTDEGIRYVIQLMNILGFLSEIGNLFSIHPLNNITTNPMSQKIPLNGNCLRRPRSKSSYTFSREYI